MKKLYLSILAVLCPAIIYCAVFFAFDPHDYFHRSETPTDFDSLIGHMLDFRHNDYNAILLGDSRTARIEDAELSDATGYRCKNMSFAGCTVEEYVKLFWWCLDQQPDLKSVVVVTSFYGANSVLQKDRVTPTDKIIQNPVTYAFSTDNFSDMLDVIRGKEPENSQTVIVGEEKEKNFAEYAKGLETILPGYACDYQTLDSLIEVCDYCKEHDIQIKVVLPSWWKEYYSYLDRYSLKEAAEEYKQYLAPHVDLYDLEYDGCALNDAYEDYRDYTHTYVASETFAAWMRVILAGETTYAHVL